MKRFLSILFAACVLVTSVPTTTFAAPPPEEPVTTIPDVMSGYLLSCQPDDAIYPNDENKIVLTEDNTSHNYNSDDIQGKGLFVYDLPRLTDEYYYTITSADDEYGITLMNALYPTIKLSATPNADTKLNIVRFGDDAVAMSFPIMEQGVPFVVDTEEDPNATEGIPEFIDVSNDMISRQFECYLPAEGYNSIGEYDATLHANSIITDKYIVTSSNLDSNDAYVKATPANTKLCNINTVFVTDIGSTDAVTVKHDDFMRMLTRDFRSDAGALLLCGDTLSWKDSNSPDDIYEYTTYNNNTHQVSYRLYSDKHKMAEETFRYMISTSDYCYLYNVTDSMIVSTMQGEPSDYAQSLAVSENEIESILAFPKLGPIDYSSFKSYISNVKVGEDHLITMVTEDGVQQSNYQFKYVNYKGAANATYNLYGMCPLFSTAIPSVRKMIFVKPEPKVHVTYHVKTPDSVSFTDYGPYDYLLSDYNNMRNFATYSDLEVPAQASFYGEDCWYIAAEMTSDTKRTITDIRVNTEEDTYIDLYGGFVDNSPLYNFYTTNDGGNNYVCTTYKTTVKPTIPENPTSSTGSRFSHWSLVTSLTDTADNPFDINTFTPQEGQSYWLKPIWDNSGNIKSVKTSKTSYYVGSKIDKSSLVVTVVGDDGNDRVLAPNEFTVSPDTVTGVGPFQFVVTYNAKGTTAVCSVKGIEVVPKSISAVYNGSDLVVGTSLNRNDFVVTVKYNDDSTKTTTNFTISPDYVRIVGRNTITVKYQTMSTSVYVTGLSAVTDDPNPVPPKKTLKSISAKYVGGTKKVNDYLYGSDFTVTATYSDKSTSILASDAFTISPGQLTSAGTNRITIKYSGKSTHVDVTAKSATDSSSSTDRGNGSGSGNSSNTDKTNPSTDNKNNANTTTANKNNTTTTDNKNNTSTSGSSANSDSDEKGPSPYYLGGATIDKNQSKLGQKTGDASEQTNEVDILKTIKNASASASTVTVKLTNGAKGNDITGEMLSTLRNRKMTLEVYMLDYQTGLEVGRWTIKPDADENKSTTFDPNIGYVTQDLETCRSLFINLSASTFPSTASLTVSPLSHNFSIGAPVKLYTCNTLGNEAHLLNTITWSSSVAFDVDLNKRCYCLSDSPIVYDEGSSLTVDNNVTDTVSGNDIDNQESASTPTEDTTTTEEIGNTTGDSQTQPDQLFTQDMEQKKSLFPIIIIVLAILLLVVGGVFIALCLTGSSHKVSEYDDEDVTDIEFIDDGTSLEDLTVDDDTDEE